ncbi:unnamed protein product [Mucor hiemalis]
MPRTPGVPNFSNENKKVLLKVVKKLLPVGSDNWKEVEEKYNALVEAQAVKKNETAIKRTYQTLKTQFYALANKKKPTGVSTISKLIRDAKAIEREIDAKVHGVLDGATSGEEEADENNDKNEEVPSEEEEGSSDSDSSEESDDDEEEVVVARSSSVAPSVAPKKKQKQNSFKEIGEALGDDRPVRSKTTPVPRYEKKKNQASLDASISSLVEIMLREEQQQAEASISSASLLKLEEEVNSTSSALAKMDARMTAEVGGLRSMMQLMMEKMGVVLPDNEPSEEEDEGGLKKRQKLQ